MQAMVARLLEQEEAVRAVLSSDRKTSHLIPSWQDVEVLESIHVALSPLADLTDFLSGENHITISSIIPVLHNLKTKILVENEDDTNLTKDIKKKILDDLQPRYTDAGIQQLLNIATFLDPRFKTEYADDEDDLKEAVKAQALEFEVIMMSDIPVLTPQPLPSKKRKIQKEKLVTFLKKTTEVSEDPLTLSPQERVSKEMQSYLSCSKLDIESDVSPLQWWKEYAQSFPLLAKLANKWLCICATSCSSERLFSTSGNVVGPSRACLNPEKVNMLVFLAKNLD